LSEKGRKASDESSGELTLFKMLTFRVQGKGAVPCLFVFGICALLVYAGIKQGASFLTIALLVVALFVISAVRWPALVAWARSRRRTFLGILAAR
jgi:uncharacterized membrane protein YobD (UPF0266 family)